jgi:CBS domain-containing protein
MSLSDRWPCGQAGGKAQPQGWGDHDDLAHDLGPDRHCGRHYRAGVVTASADESLEQIAARLQAKDVSALVILDGYRLAGIITERDIVRAVADRRDLADGTAGEYMTPAPATVDLETPLWVVAWRMLAYGVRHLPVVVGGEVTGMVSARDLLELQSAPTP